MNTLCTLLLSFFLWVVVFFFCLWLLICLMGSFCLWLMQLVLGWGGYGSTSGLFFFAFLFQCSVDNDALFFFKHLCCCCCCSSSCFTSCCCCLISLFFFHSCVRFLIFCISRVKRYIVLVEIIIIRTKIRKIKLRIQTHSWNEYFQSIYIYNILFPIFHFRFKNTLFFYFILSFTLICPPFFCIYFCGQD